MHFKMSCAICFDLDQSKILLSGNGLMGKSMLVLVKMFSSDNTLSKSNYLGSWLWKECITYKLRKR